MDRPAANDMAKEAIIDSSFDQNIVKGGDKWQWGGNEERSGAYGDRYHAFEWDANI